MARSPLPINAHIVTCFYIQLPYQLYLLVTYADRFNLFDKQSPSWSNLNPSKLVNFLFKAKKLTQGHLIKWSCHFRPRYSPSVISADIDHTFVVTLPRSVLIFPSTAESSGSTGSFKSIQFHTWIDLRAVLRRQFCFCSAYLYRCVRLHSNAEQNKLTETAEKKWLHPDSF